MTSVITDHTGLIIEASAEAAHMLDVSVAYLRDRSLLVFFEADREASAAALREASRGAIVTRRGRLRPRRRRVLLVEVQLSQMLDHPRSDAILWTFVPAQP